MPASTEYTRKGGGGNATASGILYQGGVGALFAAHLLTEMQLGNVFGLTNARIKAIRFETSAPVDDILIETDQGGFVAIQAKATVSMSSTISSVLGSVADQFVRHWIATKRSAGSEPWARPLDPSRDRLVLVYGPGSGGTVARLAQALHGLRPDGPAGKLRDAFEELIRIAFTANGETAADEDVAGLIACIDLLELDPADRDRALAIEQLTPLFGSRDEANRGLDVLTQIAIEQMKRRGGFDSAILRTELARHGMAPGAAPTFARAIDALRAYSAATTEQLAAYEQLVPKEGNAFTLPRDCLPDILAAARTGSLVLTGEPGSGKSGVLNALARALTTDGAPVVTLAVDRLPVATLGELSDQLGLEHPLTDVLANWPGTGPAYLVIDALDATRGGPAEAVFKALIANTLGLAGSRWRVIVSIRSFDLRLGRQFRDLFKGPPPSAALADPAFAMVRHVSIPEWTDQEFAAILERSPDIGTAIAASGAPLAALARVPFNTRLLADLLSTGTPPDAFAGIATQASLLAYFWRERVDAQGSGAALTLGATISAMLAKGSLHAPANDIAKQSAAGDLDTMEREGVLVRSNGGRDLAFRHHILFDFAASRLVLDPADPAALAATLVGPAALALAPALGFVLNEAWTADPGHGDFWRIALAVTGDSAADPIARSVIARQAAELPVERSDTDALVEAMRRDDMRHAAVRVLRNLLGALSVRAEDGATVVLPPWVNVAAALPALIAMGWDEPIGALRVLLHILLQRDTLDTGDRAKLGQVARAFLVIALEKPVAFPQAAIGFVGKTYDTDIAASRDALGALLTPERLDQHASTDAPALAHEISAISAADPDFAAAIYRQLFTYDVTDEATTSLGNSQILSLTSTRRQDYSIARYALAEAFPAFLAAHPPAAIAAMVAAIECQAARETGADLAVVEPVATTAGTFPLVADHSFVWAWDIEDRHPSDAEKLLQATTTYLTEAPPERALAAATLLRDQARYGILWSRFLHAAAQRPQVLGELAWPIASAGGFLTANETSKDAIDAALAILPRRTPRERARFEEALLALDVSGFNDPATAHTLFLRKTLGAIGAPGLVTDQAQAWIALAGDDAAPVENRRPFAVHVSHGRTRSFAEEAGIAPDDAAGLTLFEAVEAVREKYGLIGDEIDLGNPAALLDDIEQLRETIEQSGVDAPQTVANASDPIIKACHALTANSGSGIADLPQAVDRLIKLVDWLSRQVAPMVREDTEANFADSPSWGSPAPRVDAADLVVDLLLIDPGQVERLLPLVDQALADPHPAVRLMVAQRLTALWFVDRALMWPRVAMVAEREPNPGVLRFFAGNVLARLLSEPDTLEPIVLQLADRDFATQERRRTIEDHIAELLTALWLLPAREASQARVAQKLADDIVDAKDFLFEATSVAGQLIGAGYEDDERVAVRARAQALTAAIIDRAADTLDAQLKLPPADRDNARIEASVTLLDNAVRKIRSAALGGRSDEGAGLQGQDARAQYLDDLAPTLHRLGDVAPPRALHELIEFLDSMIDAEPARCFELIAHGILTAGDKFGYQDESLGADRVVKVVGRTLADHRWIFDDAARRAQLVEILELFVDRGWPQARRLLYELPDLFR
ncbi:MAG: ATP-binding protein [Sphingomonas sp.]|uniref:hypothetical protein n=1 Tax=Sphingomonas sp. TaxID=28214 RepID=UPI0025DBBFC3|nr:hypothetical protein [Sphingomonas sp.]MBQ1500389.1 ATP-binding protein [Sphingomonas sp.]MBQ8102668.1 ATP-binding protein [Afipia sp.]